MIEHRTRRVPYTAAARPQGLRALLTVTLSTLALVPLPTPLAGQAVDEIAGAWVGGEVLPIERPDSQVNYFSLRPDGSLALSMIYEVGPRSRVWTHDIDVTYENGAVSWAAHQGILSPGRDTMRVLKDFNGEQSDWMWVRRPELDSLLIRLHGLEATPFEYNLPPELDDGWPSGNPEEVGLDRETLSAFLTSVARGDHGDLHSVLVARHGTLVIEEYFAEGGSKHGPFIASVFRDRVHHLASTTKSIVSVLVGIALDRRYIGSVQDPITRYFPDHASLLSGGKEAINIGHLLSMSPGLQWFGRNSPGMVNDDQAAWQAEDIVEYALGKPLFSDPGTRFNYSNATAAVAGALLENATGTDVRAFAREYLYQPLGITGFLWTSYPDGTVETDGGLALRPRDLAKIGQLYLDGGRWGEVQIVPTAWVEESTRGRFRYGSVGSSPVSYGYFWMEAVLPSPEGEVRSFFHTGDGGQFLMVIPDLDLVIVLTGGIYGRSVVGAYVPLIVRHILSAMKAPE
jgi:CubicO group peptidase (beta-lactamase class C family)